MKYVHGVRTELRYDEMTPLDKAIDRYSKQADEYYRKEAELKDLPPDVRKKRQQELEEAKCFLDHQRMSAEVCASIQAQLDAYREAGRAAASGARSEVAAKQRVLLAENHHPTAELVKYMTAVGRPAPSRQHSAHHVVPGKGKTKEANLARVHMHRFGVRINDPANGVWLPTYKKHTPHWATPHAKGHLEYHTAGYEAWIRKRLRTRTGEWVIRTELQIIARLLQSDALPKEARKKV